MKLYTTRKIFGRVIGPDGKPGHARCPFPAQFGDTLIWVPLIEEQITEGKEGDLCLVMGGVTLSSKQFVKHWLVQVLMNFTRGGHNLHKGETLKVKPVPDFVTKYPAYFNVTTVYGSAMLRCMLMLHIAPQAQPYLIAPRPPGLLCGLGSGTNSTEKDNLTPYQQPPRFDVVPLPCDAPYLTLLAAAASGDADASDFIEAYATSEEYAFLTALLLGPAS